MLLRRVRASHIYFECEVCEATGEAIIDDDDDGGYNEGSIPPCAECDGGRCLVFFSEPADYAVPVTANYLDDIMMKAVTSASAESDEIKPAVPTIPLRAHLLDFADCKDSLETECPICMEKDERGAVVLKECGHEFHAQCIEPWLREVSSTCPVCRKKIEPDA